jgi:hypothetical protein
MLMTAAKSDNWLEIARPSDPDVVLASFSPDAAPRTLPSAKKETRGVSFCAALAVRACAPMVFPENSTLVPTTANIKFRM